MAPRRITLYDTRTRGVQPLEPRDPGQVGIYACGPTVYSRIHVGNARPYVDLPAAQALPRARGLRRRAGDQRHRRQRQDLRRGHRGRRGLRRAGARDDRRTTSPTPTGSGSAAPTTSRWPRRRSGRSSSLIDDLIDSEHAYVADGDVYFRVRSLPAYGELSRRDIEQMDQGEGVEGAERKAGPARLRAVEGREGRRGHRVGLAVGPRPAGLAHRVLGDGRDAARPRVRHPRRRAATSSSRTTRTRPAQTLAARGRPLARIWMHNGMVELGGGGGRRPRRREDVQVASATSAGWREVLDEVGRDALVLYFCAGPLPPAARLLARAPGGGRPRAWQRIREAGRRLVPGDSPADLAPLREAFFDALADDFNTPRALAAVSDWIREANRRGRGRRRRRACARCSASSGSRTCSTAAREAPPAEIVEPGRAPRRGARAARLRARPTACATSCARAAGRCATGPAGPSSSRRMTPPAA